MAARNVITLRKWGRVNHKMFGRCSDVLLRNRICYHVSKTQDLLWNLQQNLWYHQHVYDQFLCIYITHSQGLLALCCVFSWSVNIELQSLTQISHATKTKQKQTSKGSKKNKKKLRLLWNCHQSTSPVNGYTIIPSTVIDRGERTMKRRFHGAVNLPIADCVD